MCIFFLLQDKISTANIDSFAENVHNCLVNIFFCRTISSLSTFFNFFSFVLIHSTHIEKKQYKIDQLTACRSIKSNDRPPVATYRRRRRVGDSIASPQNIHTLEGKYACNCLINHDDDGNG